MEKQLQEIKRMQAVKVKLAGALRFYQKRNIEFLEKNGMLDVLEFLLVNETRYKHTFEIQPKEKKEAIFKCALILTGSMIALSKEKLDQKFIISEFHKVTPLSLILNEPTNTSTILQ